jgi:aspartyl-tRNA(Asn)/glutamyl-tRNA(Gln) amidotransferase subunit C
MTFTNEDVKKLAKLARLHISEEETKDYQEKLGSILEYVEQLQEVDTSSVPELQSATGVTNVFREDVEEGCEKDVRDAAIKMFIHKKGDLLEVQAAIEGNKE